MGIARQDPFQIILPAALWRAPRVEPERLSREARFGEEGGQRGRDDDERAPPGKPREQCRVGGQDEQLLAERSELEDERERPHAGLAPRVLHLVVGVGVLEMAQLERRCLFEDERVDVIAERGAHQVAQERLRARQDGGDDHQAELDQHVLDDAPLVSARARARRLHDSVDDQLADPCHRRWDEGLAHHQRDDSRGEPARGIVDEPEDARKRAQVAQGEPGALAKRLWRGPRQSQCSRISCTFILSSR